MSRKINAGFIIKYALIEAIAFCIPAFIFIKSADFQKSWLLFLGCFLFLIVTIIHTLMNNRLKAASEQTSTLVFQSLMVTIAGIILSCILSFCLLAVLIPGYLSAGAPEKTNGLSFKVFLTAVVGNFSVGSFAGILLPFYSA